MSLHTFMDRCLCCDEKRDFREFGSFSVATDRDPNSPNVEVPICNVCFEAGCADEWTWKKQFKCQLPQDPGEPLPRIISTETGIVLFDEDAMSVRS